MASTTDTPSPDAEQPQRSGTEQPPQPGAEQPQPGTEQAVQAVGEQHFGPAERTCSNCGSPLARDQDWCTNCGAGAPGALQRPRWRSTGAIAAGVVVLALGAAAAGAAALKQHSPARATIVKVAQAPSATTPTPSPSTTTTPPAPTQPKLPLKVPKTKLPKIPLTALKPGKASTKPPANKAAEGNAGNTGATGEGKTGGESEGGESGEPSAIVLDTDAASTYNPYGLPASYFGDPSLTIDGDSQTAWTAQVNPATAPAMAEGLLLALGSPTKVSTLELATSTPGMTVQVWSTAEQKPPESIVDPGWTPLSRPFVVKKHATHLKLHALKKGPRYVLLWISKAPADQIGTAQAPGHVAVGELELFPPS